MPPNSTIRSFMFHDHIHISLKFLTRSRTESRMLLAVLLHSRNPQEDMNKTAYDSQRESPLAGSIAGTAGIKER